MRTNTILSGPGWTNPGIDEFDKLPRACRLVLKNAHADFSTTQALRYWRKRRRMGATAAEVAREFQAAIDKHFPIAQEQFLKMARGNNA